MGDGQSTGWERRLVQRLVTQGLLEVEVTNENSNYTGRVKDLSAGGMFIMTSRIHRVGQRLHLRVRLPGSTSPLVVDGVVLHPHETAQVKAEGIGVKFIHLSQEANASLRSYLTGRL